MYPNAHAHPHDGADLRKLTIIVLIFHAVHAGREKIISVCDCVEGMKVYQNVIHVERKENVFISNNLLGYQ